MEKSTGGKIVKTDNGRFVFERGGRRSRTYATAAEVRKRFNVQSEPKKTEQSGEDKAKEQKAEK